VQPAALTVACLLAAVAAASPLAAQAGTDIYLAPLRSEAGRFTVGEPVNVTKRAGYDNQPFFTPDGRSLLYTSIDAGGRADIHRLDIAAGRSVNVTNTPESEYSATPLPDGGFSVIRVEADSAQRLWRFAADGTSPSLVLADVEPVGYHAWGDASTLALFVLGSPATLQIADARSGRARVIAEGIGRSLQKIPGGAEVTFVRRTGEDGFRVEAVDVRSGTTRVLVDAVPGGEFHAWTPDGALLMTSGMKLYEWRPTSPRWREVADFTAQGLRLSRIAVSPAGDRIALVADEGG
jgi:hypothetical protein